MRCCYACGKGIKGAITWHVPPNWVIQIGADFVKVFHPKCYARVEAEAARELRGKRVEGAAARG